jgi:hypothetical protein
MFELRVSRYASQSGIRVTSWQRGNMALHKDSNQNRNCLMPLTLMGRSGSMELFHKPVEDESALGPNSIAQGFCLP